MQGATQSEPSSSVGQSTPIVLDGVGSNETLRTAADRIRKEQQFSKLRKERRDILEEIPKVKSEVDSLQVQISSLKTEKADLQQKLLTSDPSQFETETARWKSRLEAEKKRLESLQKQQADSKQTEQADTPTSPDEASERLDVAVIDAQENIDFFTARIDEIQQEKGYRENERQNNERRLKEIDAQLPALENLLSEKMKKFTELQEKQFLVEDAINVLLIPETAKNEFKLYITAAFSILVGFVILGFFVVSWRDETVRRAIFSGQSGIQFLTLFSLVIAIILFGITEVLEGKELAALLGGLSGYILGRVTNT